ncbi:MAG TPA: RNA 2',3'-cyclic phosphodiesterase [Burkholderiales bacterium]
MPEQLSLAGIEGPPVLTDGLFFAIVPSPQAADEIERRAQDFCRELGLKGRPLAREQLHVTLYYLGVHAGVPQGIVAKASETAAALRMAPFEVSFDRATSFAGKAGSRPLVLSSRKPLAALNAFQQALRTAIKKAGLDNWAQPAFTPHVTLLYDRRGVPEQAVEPLRWTVSEFVLVRSLHGMSRHEPLARWPLLD